MKSKDTLFTGIYEVLHDFRLADLDKVEDTFARLRRPDILKLLTELMVHYERNRQSIVSELPNKHSFTVFPEGGRVHVPSYVKHGENFYKIKATFDESFVSAICLYADRLVIVDPLYQELWKVITTGDSTEAYENLHTALYTVLTLKEMAEHRLLLMTPPDIIPYDKKIVEDASKADLNKTEFRNICLEGVKLSRDKGMAEGQHPYDYLVAEIGSGSPRFMHNQLHPTIPPLTNYRFVPKNLEGPSKLELYGMWTNSQIPFTFGISQGRLTKQNGLRSATIELNPKPISLESIKGDKEAEEFVESTLRVVAGNLNGNIHLAAQMNASLFLQLDVFWKLLNAKLKLASRATSQAQASKVISALLTMNLTFLDRSPIDKLIEIREKENVFYNFRAGMAELTKDLDAIPMSNEFEEKVIEIKREKIDPSLETMDEDIRRIKEHRSLRGAVGIGIGVASVTATALVGGNPLSALFSALSAGGIFEATREYIEYRREKSLLRKNPMYFLWKVKQLSK